MPSSYTRRLFKSLATGQRERQRKESERERKMIEEQLDVLFAKAGDGVEGALFPITSFALKVTDVQLISKPFHDLFREQVIDQSGLDASIVVHQLKQMR